MLFVRHRALTFSALCAASAVVLAAALFWPPAAEPGTTTAPISSTPAKLPVTLSPQEFTTVHATTTLRTKISASNADVIDLGAQSARQYYVTLPTRWIWSRDIVIGKLLPDGSPLFDERFVATDGLQTDLRLVIQSNLRTEITPLFPDAPYCRTDITLEFSAHRLPGSVYSTLQQGEQLERRPRESCPQDTTPRFADIHVAELRACLGPADILSTPLAVRGLTEVTNDCPAKSDYLRFTLTCQGPSSAGVDGQNNCVSLLQTIITSFGQRAN